MARSLLIIAIEALVSAGLGVPGSRGFINPTAVLGGVHCCCYLYLWLCSPSKESQLGLCFRDTEPWLLSKLGLRRALPPAAPRLHWQRRVNRGSPALEMETCITPRGGGQEDGTSWDFASPLVWNLRATLSAISPPQARVTDSTFLSTTVL